MTAYRDHVKGWTVQEVSRKAPGGWRGHRACLTTGLRGLHRAGLSRSRGWLPGLMLSLLFQVGCAHSTAIAPASRPRPPLSVEARLQALEERSLAQNTALEGLNLRVDSVSTGLDRLTERLNQSLPLTAQWLKLEKGGVLRWYIDERLQSVYSQFMAFNATSGRLEVAISTKEGSQILELGVGQAVEVKLSDGTQARSFTLRCHALLQLADQTRYGQLSLVEGGAPSP